MPFSVQVHQKEQRKEGEGSKAHFHSQVPLLGGKKLDAVDFKVNIFHKALAGLFYLSCPVLFTGFNQLVGWQFGDKRKGQKMDSHDSSHKSVIFYQP